MIAMLGHRLPILIMTLLAAVITAHPSYGEDNDVAEFQRQLDELRSRVGVGPLVITPAPPKEVVENDEEQDAGETRSEENADIVADEAEIIRRLQPQSHVKAEGGIPFPRIDEVVMEPFPTPEIDSSAQESSEYSNFLLTPIPEYQRPKKCEASITETFALESEVDEKDEKIQVDSLFLSEDLMPMDPTDVFGSKVKVYPYGPSSSEAVYLQMKNDHVPCVPYRIRFSNRAVYIDSGNNALKNYDTKPSGRGVYHMWIQKKLFLRK